ncbi:MAG: hypothetical protein U1F43_28985 [Myxococcota bacterium]
MLVRQHQQLARGRQHAAARGHAQPRGDGARGHVDHLIEVVEHEQRVAALGQHAADAQDGLALGLGRRRLE